MRDTRTRRPARQIVASTMPTRSGRLTVTASSSHAYASRVTTPNGNVTSETSRARKRRQFQHALAAAPRQRQRRIAGEERDVRAQRRGEREQRVSVSGSGASALRHRSTAPASALPPPSPPPTGIRLSISIAQSLGHPVASAYAVSGAPREVALVGSEASRWNDVPATVQRTTANGRFAPRRRRRARAGRTASRVDGSRSLRERARAETGSASPGRPFARLLLSRGARGGHAHCASGCGCGVLKSLKCRPRRAK